ncbi:protein phosphatase 1, regulatory subunit 8a isoform X1 [Colossoma macropomum]|uniref:protein phosphatase 1, regulatory subunit 8a isoform X1 n=1 Tax=Colossoma macropomum TaxID=42526 RepID=UPI001864F17E|nr:protein phosphatase 1, regulatory subunit 8a isoform X1 [Colossoma macropomum]
MAANPSKNTAHFDCPSWAGKPPAGLHLDVVKGDKLIEKLIIDEKKFYLFGRNPDHCDFTIDHQSCSRVHAALVYHRHLKRVFLIDLNSTHGTFLGRIRLEPHKPQQVPIDSTMSFGASTRVYTLREKPQTQPSAATGDSGVEDEELKGLLGLPEEETELDNLTEFNTAHNKRISTLAIEEGNLDIQRPKRKRRNSRVSFSEKEEIINPEEEAGEPRHPWLGGQCGAANAELPPQLGALWRPAPHQPRGRKPGGRSPRLRHAGWATASFPQPGPRGGPLPDHGAAPRHIESHPRPGSLHGRTAQRTSQEKIRQGGVAWQEAHSLFAHLACAIGCHGNRPSQDVYMYMTCMISVSIVSICIERFSFLV